MKKNFVTFQFQICYLNLKGSQLPIAPQNVSGMNTNPFSDLGGSENRGQFPQFINDLIRPKKILSLTP